MLNFDGLPIAFHLTNNAAGDSPLLKLLLDLGPDARSHPTLAHKG